MKNYPYTIACLIVLFLLPARLSAADELRERAYLQTDKQFYLSGELLWMKFYLTDREGKPSSFSKVGYVELLDGASSLLQAKIEIKEGTGEGWLELPATLPSGYYRLTGYTRQMMNEGEAVFFNKRISIVNTFRADEAVEVDTAFRSAGYSVLENTLSVTTGQSVYPVRSEGSIRLQGLPANVHSLAVSVAGKDTYTADGMNITRWEKQLEAVSAVPYRQEYLPEYEGHVIRGRVVDVETGSSDHIAEKVSPLLGFVGNRIRVFGGQVQENNADVSFFTKRIGGMHEVATTSFAPSGKKYRIDVQSPFATHPEVSMPPFRMNPSWKDELLKRSVGLQVLHTYTADSLSLVDPAEAHFQWQPDRSYILDEYTRFTTMEEVVIEFIPALRFRRISGRRFLAVLNEERTGFSIGNSLLLLDGVPINDHETIFRYDPHLLHKIEVYKSKFVFGSQYYEGLILMTSYKHDYPSLKVDESTQFFDYEGTLPHRRFYAPSYAGGNVSGRVPDYRHTLLWAPDVRTGNRSSVDIPFSTSDLTGEFQVTVEGLTTDGQVVRGVAQFRVQ